MEIEPRDGNDPERALIVAGVIDVTAIPEFLDRVRGIKRFVGLPQTDPVLVGRSFALWKHVTVNAASVLTAITAVADGS